MTRANATDATSGPLPGTGILELGSDLTIRAVGRQKEQMTALLDAGDTVVLNAVSIEHVDTAGLQLVAAFASDLLAAGRELQWNQPPDRLLEAAALLGLTEALQLGAQG